MDALIYSEALCVEILLCGIQTQSGAFYFQNFVLCLQDLILFHQCSITQHKLYLIPKISAVAGLKIAQTET